MESNDSVIVNELDRPIWVVMSSGGVKTPNVTHAEAWAVIDELQRQSADDSGLCVVTVAAAGRSINGSANA
jgi:hypothetical protein